MIKRAERKFNQRGGFTLAESLVTLLIFLMVSSIVAAGIPAAREAFVKVTRRANAETLLSTTAASLRKQLAAASEVQAGDDGKSLLYFDSSRGIQAKLYTDAESGVIMLQEYIAIGEAAAGSPEAITRRLVTDAASTPDLFVTYEEASFAGQLVTIRNLKVCRRQDAEGAAVTSIPVLFIRVIGERPGEGG